MSFTVNDTAPVSGYYKVTSRSGVFAGRIYLEAGVKFPPSASPTQYYEPEKPE